MHAVSSGHGMGAEVERQFVSGGIPDIRLVRLPETALIFRCMPPKSGWANLLTAFIKPSGKTGRRPDVGLGGEVQGVTQYRTLHLQGSAVPGDVAVLFCVTSSKSSRTRPRRVCACRRIVYTGHN